MKRAVFGWRILTSVRQVGEKTVNTYRVTSTGRNLVLLPCCTTHNSQNRNLNRLGMVSHYIPLQIGSQE